jgi:hypothetical protein
MAQLYAALTELPDQVKEQMELGEVSQKSEFMQGFFRGRSEGLLIGQEEGAFSEQERIIKLLKEMRDACLGSGGNIGEHNAWTLENAIIFIKGEQNADIPSV